MRRMKSKLQDVRIIFIKKSSFSILIQFLHWNNFFVFLNYFLLCIEHNPNQIFISRKTIPTAVLHAVMLFTLSATESTMNFISILQPINLYAFLQCEFFHCIGKWMNKWKPLSLSKLNPVISNMEVTHLGSKAIK